MVENGSLKVFETATGKLLLELPVDREARPIWEPNSSRICLGSLIVRLPNANNSLQQSVEVKLSTPVRLLKGSEADGRVAVVEVETNIIRIFEANGTQSLALSDFSLPVCDMDWSFDGRLLAVIESSGELTIWDSYTGKLVQRISTEFTNAPLNYQAVNHQILWSPDGRYIALDFADSMVRVIEIAGHRTVFEIPQSDVRVLGWTMSPQRLHIQFRGASSVFPRLRGSSVENLDGVNRVLSWDPNTGQKDWFTLALPESSVSQLKVPRRCNFLLGLGWTGFIFEPLNQSGNGISSSAFAWLTRSTYRDFAVAPTGNRVFAIDQRGRVSVIDMETGFDLIRLANTEGDAQLAFGDGYLWLADRDTLRVFDGRELEHQFGSVTTASFSVMDVELRNIREVFGALTFALVGLVWSLADRSLKLSGTQRWIAATTMLAAGIVILFQKENLTTAIAQLDVGMSSSDWLNAVIGILLGLGASILAIELLRLWTKGQFEVSVISLLATGCVALAIFVWQTWPNNQLNRGDEFRYISPRPLVDLGIVIGALAGFVMFAIRLMSREIRETAKRFDQAPRWVTWGLLGSKSMTGVVFGVLSCWGGAGVLALFALQFSRAVANREFLIILAAAVLLAGLGIWTALSAHWIVCHGGWKRQHELQTQPKL